jgi:hypothetical protein
MHGSVVPLKWCECRWLGVVGEVKLADVDVALIACVVTGQKMYRY